MARSTTVVLVLNVVCCVGSVEIQIEILKRLMYSRSVEYEV